MTTIDGIPVYRVLVDDENDGMVRVSLVDDPAVMSDFVAFDAQKPAQLFAVESDEKRLVFGVVARADFPIFRKDERLGDHYVIFPADSIRELAQKYLTEGRADNVDEMHDQQDVGGVHLVQWFLKDTAAGINPAGFEEIADGSLFAEYHVEDDEIWAQIKAGTFRGFSMEVFYTLQPENNAGYVREAVEDADGMFERIIDAITNPRNMNNKKNLLRKLGRLLASFATVTTDKGVLAWDGDEDLKAGDRVYIEDAEGERAPAADGDYKTEDGKTIVVADGAVSEIRDPEAQVGSEGEFGNKSTDKGTLYWEGEEDLKEGDAVFVENEDGERSAAPDGEYRTEDGKVITVVDGVVASITDDQAEVEPAELSRHNRVRAIFEESFQEKEMAIYEALKAIGLEYPWLVEAAETYAVVCVWADGGEKFYRYDLSFNEDGSVTLGDSQEVKQMFVPVDFVSPFEDNSAAEEVEQLRKQIDELKAENAKLARVPLKDPAKKTVTDNAPAVKGAPRGVANLSRYLKN
jgi:hypothetical protein